MIDYREITKGSFLLPRRNFLVIVSPHDPVWDELSTTNSDSIDWGRELVIGLFGGTKPSGGYGIEILDLQLSGRVLQVTFGESTPKASGIVSQAMTYPGQLIAVFRESLPTGALEAEFVAEHQVVARKAFQI